MMKSHKPVLCGKEPFMSIRSLAYLPFVAILYAFIYLHTKIYTDGDITYLLIAAQRMLQGGQYVRDFFESNPPMILYLYIPAVWLAKWTPDKLFLLFDSYVFVLIMLSMWGSYCLLKRMVQDKFICLGMLYALTVILLLLCYEDYGQREHLFLILTLPYFFAAALRYQRQDIKVSFAVYIGVLAGLGFAIKPTFLIPLCLVELAIIIHQRRLLAWISTESLVVITILCLYLASVFILTNSYIHTILPFVSKYYFKGGARPWNVLLLDPLLIYCFSCTIGYFIFAKYDRYPALGKMLLLTQIGMIISCVVTRTIWFYHILPAFSLSFLLLTFCLLQLIATEKPKSWWLRLALLSVFICDAIYTLAYAYFTKPDSETTIFFYKFFSVLQIFFTLVLTMCLYWFLLHKKRFTLLITLSLLVLLMFAMYQLRNDVELFYSRSHLVFALMLFMDGWIVFNIMACLWMLTSRFSTYSLQITLAVQRIVFSTAAIFLIYFSPLNIIYKANLTELNFQRLGDKLTHYLKSTGATKVDCFSSMASLCFPMIYYSGQQFSGRESNFWWFTGLVNTPQTFQSRQDADYLVNIITADLNTNKPQKIIVDSNMFYEQNNPVFANNKNFQQAWQHYRLTVGFPDNSIAAEFYVYSRVD
jgi:hypothetical protein